MMQKLILGVILALSCWQILISAPQYHNRIVFLNVGQGDATLIQYEGVNILIDGGAGTAINGSIYEYVEAFKISFDIIILTHYHLDHYEGLLMLLNKHHYKEVYLPKPCNSREEDILSNLTKIYEVPELEISLGEDLAIVLRNINSSCALNPNNRSIVVELYVDGVAKALITGDIERFSEELLVREGLGEFEYLKLPHHCSKSSSTEAFLDAVNPKLALCAYGIDNKYGHPHQETIDRVRKRDIMLYELAIDGDLVVGL